MEECRRQMMSLPVLAFAVVAIGGDYSGDNDDDDDDVVVVFFQLLVLDVNGYCRPSCCY